MLHRFPNPPPGQSVTEGPGTARVWVNERNEKAREERVEIDMVYRFIDLS
jgi:hypothetical protein